MEGLTSKKMKEVAKRVYHKGNIKFPNPPSIARSISNKERGGPPERTPSLEELSCIITYYSRICLN
jgi:hypothetical protein